MDGNFFLEDAKNEINFMQVFFRWIFSIFSKAIEFPSKGPTKSLLLSIEYTDIFDSD